jgi:hypothetical protein
LVGNWPNDLGAGCFKPSDFACVCVAKSKLTRGFDTEFEMKEIWEEFPDLCDFHFVDFRYSLFFIGQKWAYIF